MANRTDIRYANVPIEPEVFGPLGLDPAEAGVPQIRAALRRYGMALSHARQRLAKVFDRAEWNLMADVMNGCADLQDYGDSPIQTRVMIAANVEDGHRLDGVGGKWFGGDDADARVNALLRKLAKLSPIEADAVGVAIRSFWADPGVDPTAEEWWLPGRPRREEGGRS